MLGLGTWGFGGPVALVGSMYRDLVEQRGWIAESEYKEGLAIAQLMPGPLAAQLAIYLGYVHYRVRGATLAGLAFVLPSFLMVVTLGALYRAFGGLVIPAPYFKKHGKRPAIVAFVDGVTAAAIGAIAGAVIVIAQRSITDWLGAALAIVTGLVLWKFRKVPEPAIVLAAALIGLVAYPLMHR